MTTRAAVGLVLAWALVACEPEAQPAADGGPGDAAVADAGGGGGDAGAGDAGGPLDGGEGPDGGADLDAGPAVDGGAPPDAGQPSDAGLQSDGGQPADAGGSDAGRTDAGRVDAGRFDGGGPWVDGGWRGVFVATGAVGRTISSFDDGQSWEADQSDQAGTICTSATNANPATYCYEGAKTARGVAYLDGAFFVTFDWSREPQRANSVRRSTDGRTWTDVLVPGGFGGIAAGNGAVVLAGPSGTTYMRRTLDFGTTWTQHPNGAGTWVNFRHAAFVQALGGRFVIGGDNNGFEAHRVAVSTDGASWRVPGSADAACPTNFRLTGGFGSVGNRIVMLGTNGTACRSDDGGDTWVVTQGLGRNPTSHDLVSTGTRLYAWSSGRVHWTTDGATWSEAPTTPAGVSIGGVAWSPDTGTFVAVTSGYLSGYAGQRFYRSTDGVAWTELPAANYVKSHPILGIAYGRVRAP